MEGPPIKFVLIPRDSLEMLNALLEVTADVLEKPEMLPELVDLLKGNVCRARAIVLADMEQGSNTWETLKRDLLDVLA